MFERIRDWILNHQAISFVIGLGVVGALALVLATGLFQVETSRFFAAGPRCDVNNDECDQLCASGSGFCDEISGDLGEDGRCSCDDPVTVAPNADGSCDPGFTRVGSGCVEDSASAPQPCVPVSAASWMGGSNACEPESAGIAALPAPENWLIHATVQNRTGLPSLATSAPYGSEKDGYRCFGFTVPEGNEWDGIDARSGGGASPPKKTYTLTGEFFNNCPWPVEMTGGATGSPKAGNDYIFQTDGSIDEPTVNLDSRITRNTTQTIPSCWNYAHIQGTTSPPSPSGLTPEQIEARNRAQERRRERIEDRRGAFDSDASPVFSVARVSDYIGKYFGIRAAFASQHGGCEGNYSIALDWGFDAGRMEVSLGWIHNDEVGSAPGGVTSQDGFNIVVTGSRNCTGTTGEDCAGEGATVGGFAGGGGGGGGTTGINGPGPGGSFNCGTGEGSNACWCGEWGDAIWAQRHANAGHACVPGYTLTAEYKAFLAENVPAFGPGDGAPDGTTDGDILDWSQGLVQEFIDTMGDNFNSNSSCSPRASGVDYAGIQDAYFAISASGIGLSGNGSAAVGALCRLDIDIEPVVLEATCLSGPSIRLEWDIPLGAVANGLIRRVDGGEGQFQIGIGNLQDNFTDTDVSAGHTYQYQHKVHASVASEPVDVEITEDGTCIIDGEIPDDNGGGDDDDDDDNGGDDDNDNDNDGIPDDIDPDDDNDGIPDFQDPTPKGTTGGQVNAAAAAQTGPAAATFLAFMLASVTVLLYVSYTHTSLFRRGEINKLKDDQDSMDFRA